MMVFLFGILALVTLPFGLIALRDSVRVRRRGVRVAGIVTGHQRRESDDPEKPGRTWVAFVPVVL